MLTTLFSFTENQLATIYTEPGDSAQDILRHSSTTQEAIQKSVNGLWRDVLSGGIYGAISDLALALAIISLMFFGFKLMKMLLESENYSDFPQEIILAILVILLLANQGFVLATITHGLRGIINNTNQLILAHTHTNVSLEDAYKRVMYDMGTKAHIASLVAQCDKKTTPTEKTKCLENAADNAQQIADIYQQNHQKTGLGKILDDFRKQPIITAVDLAATPAVFNLQLIIQGWLIAFGMAFQWFIEISMLLTALIGPISVGMTLFPAGSRTIFLWLIAFCSVGMLKIFYNIIVGLISVIVLNSNHVNDMAFALFIGLLAPFLSTALAAGGGMVIMNSFMNASRMLLSFKFF